ncbi:hypothetical protein FBY40_2830 [Microbacterium sp. SLBN-154]|uniref:hypothetical protein n=1 Tax=Microbacterium sp. SLBN-154 TaxID=2768458 RepID=UPI00114DC62F|nr:hypothetical protein [Microbacterium sp. SLBN-154]TQK20301.1 hypothetical protein FBY40_2830 [Microbacterium sp. SLBN-154]
MKRSRTLPLLVAAAAIVVGALLQAATAVPGLGRVAPVWFVLAALASLLVLWGQLSSLTWAITALDRDAASVRVLPIAAWSGITLIVVGVLLVVFPPGAALAGLAALFILPGASAGMGRAVGGAGRTIRRHPWRSVLLALGAVIALVTLAIAAVASGLFLTGFLGGAAMWIAFGTAAAVLLAAAARLQAAR